MIGIFLEIHKMVLVGLNVLIEIISKEIANIQSIFLNQLGVVAITRYSTWEAPSWVYLWVCYKTSESKGPDY